MSRFRALLLVSSLIPLAACGNGADDVASPGEGVLIVPAPGTPAPPPPTTPPPTGTPPGTPAASCPTGTTDGGVLGSRRLCQVPSRFTQDTTLQNVSGVAYSLVGPVNVGTDCGGSGAQAGCQAVTLTIQAGALVAGASGNDYLVVNRGSRINAVGTAQQPIIFTARDNLRPATDPQAVTDNTQGLWGGIVLLGRAPISDCNTQLPGGDVNCQNVIEGTTGSLYGGNVATDNSGTMRYVQIRFSGFAIAPGNELQGLTMGGVGSRTTIDHVQVHNSSDDAIEIFGGRVNTKYTVLTGPDDDGLDTDVGYRGTNQFVLYVQRPGGTDRGNTAVEADSNGNEDALPRQYTRVSNMTAIQRAQTSTDGNLITLRGGTDYALLNSVLSSAQACIDIDETGGTTTRAPDPGLQDLGAPIFRSVVMSCAAPFRNDNNVSVDAVRSIFGPGANNNNENYTPSLTNVFVNGATENAVPVTNPTAFNEDRPGGPGSANIADASAPNQFEAVTFIGAVSAANQVEYQGWTCSSGYASFGANSGSCNVVPTT